MQPKIILDTRKQITAGTNAGRYHCKIKVSIPVFVDGVKTWKPKRAKTGVYCTEKEFKAMMGDRTPPALRASRDTLDELLRKARSVCKMAGITPEQYVRYMEGKGNFENVVGMFDYYIGECLKEDAAGEAHDGNAMVLQTAKRFFIRYKGSEYISFAEVNKEWLENCKQWALTEIRDEKGKLIKRALSPATFFMYCRALRTVMNLAVDPFRKITKDEVPFGEGRSRFKIPNGKKKRKIKLEMATEKLTAEKNKILSYVSEYPAMNRYLNYWRASYFGNGANMADILRWRIGDIQGDWIVFDRKKTINTDQEEEPIKVMISPELREIISKEGNKSLDPEEYIFPVLKKGMSSAERKQAVNDFVRIMHRSLARAAKAMGLEIKLSPGSARYLMSTILDRAGIPKSVIKELLGHNSETMQGHYVSPYMVELMGKVNKVLAG